MNLAARTWAPAAPGEAFVGNWPAKYPHCKGCGYAALSVVDMTKQHEGFPVAVFNTAAGRPATLYRMHGEPIPKMLEAQKSFLKTDKTITSLHTIMLKEV